MNNLLPPRSDFNVTEQVYEFFRSLASKNNSIDKNSTDDQISMLIGFFSSINKDIINLNNNIDNLEIQVSANIAIIKELEKEKRELYTINNNYLNTKINKIEELLSLVPEESELSLFKSLKSLKVKIYTYSGTMSASTLTKNIAISELFGQSECSIEVIFSGGNLPSTQVNCNITTPTNILLTRFYANISINFILKVKDYTNG